MKEVAPGEPRKRPFPTPCTVRDALTRYCDLTSLPHKSVLKDLCCFVSNASEREALDELLGESGIRDFKKYVKEAEMNLKEFVLIFMSSATFQFGGFVQLTARQHARPYTISSSSVAQPKVVSITVTQVYESQRTLDVSLKNLKNAGMILELSNRGEEFSEISNRERTYHGVCSSFLCNRVSPNDLLSVTIKPSSFRLPQDCSKPIIMIATGAGVAPFRGFLRQFLFENQPRGENVLFFGCTRSDHDFIYRSEIEEALQQKESVLAHLFCAFSREQPNKVYVQHKLKEEQDLVWRLLESGGYIFICGGTAMGREVIETIGRITAEKSSRNDYVEKLREEKRIVEELWG